MAVDRLSAMTVFVRVVELGSFAREAERLSISNSAASRQVAELEAHLDARLLNRTTRRISLTEAGQAFFERSVQLLADVAEAESAVRTSSVEPKGRLRVTCGISFGTRRLAPAIAEFGARHSKLAFDLDLSDRVVDLVEEGFDLAVRVGTGGPPGLVSRVLGHTRLVCCAAPAYLARHGTPTHPRDLARHDCLEYSYVAPGELWNFDDASGEKHPVRIGGRVRSNNGRMLAELAALGMGVVLEPDFIVEPEIRAGRLQQLLPEFRAPRTPIAAVYPSRRHLSPKVRAFVDFLATRFSGEGDGRR
jgi:DNA-binding transcriptional LysR family regulator